MEEVTLDDILKMNPHLRRKDLEADIDAMRDSQIQPKDYDLATPVNGKRVRTSSAVAEDGDARVVRLRP